MVGIIFPMRTGGGKAGCFDDKNDGVSSILIEFIHQINNIQGGKKFFLVGSNDGEFSNYREGQGIL